MIEVKISLNGRITLPSSIRKKLGLVVGDVLIISESGDSSVVLEVKKKDKTTCRSALDSIAASKGIWKGRSDFDNDELRRMREADFKRNE